MKTKHRAKSDAVLPRELAGDFPEPVGPTASRDCALNDELRQMVRATYENPDVYRTHVLGMFPDDKHTGGPVHNPFHDVDPTADQFIRIPRDPDRRLLLPPEAYEPFSKRVLGIDRAYGPDQTVVQRPLPTGMGDHITVTDGIACNPPTPGRQVDVDGRCPCCTERIRLRYSNFRG